MPEADKQSARILESLKSAYARHGIRNPGFWILANYHVGRWSRHLPQPLRWFGSMSYSACLAFSEFVLHSALHRETPVGESLHLIHATDIRISPSAVIGSRVGIAHGVTIGTSPDRAGEPIIGDDVFIGAGAKILGPVRIGDRARIAANSLVISDVPADATAIGIPARIIQYTGRPSSPRSCDCTAEFPAR